MKSLLFIIAVLILPLNLCAAQRLQVKDGDQIQVVISRKDVSRLAVEGEGRLKKVWSPDGYLDLQPDKAQGEAFFKASDTAPTSFSFFARDDFGNTFTIVATQKNVPSQTIMLSPSNNQRSSDTDINRKALPYKKEVNSLFKAMFLDKKSPGYTISTHNEIVPVWKETEIKLIKTYKSHSFFGEVYQISNISLGKLEFHESEFFEFGNMVLAVGLEHLTLGVKHKTKLYVVRRADGEL